MYMCDSTVDGGRAYGTLFAFLGRSSAEICIPEMHPRPVFFIHVPTFGITFRSLRFSGPNGQQTIKWRPLCNSWSRFAPPATTP